MYNSVNPVTNVPFHEAVMTSDDELEKKLRKAHEWFQKNRRRGQDGVDERFEKLGKVAALLRERVDEYAKLMTQEMGKPLVQSEAEVLKCAAHVEWSIKNSAEFMQDEILSTRQHRAFVTHDPIGPFLDIVPWNFPFWMPIKSMVQPLVLGNPILMKHAPSTPLCA